MRQLPAIWPRPFGKQPWQAKSPPRWPAASGRGSGAARRRCPSPLSANCRVSRSSSICRIRCNLSAMFYPFAAFTYEMNHTLVIIIVFLLSSKPSIWKTSCFQDTPKNKSMSLNILADPSNLQPIAIYSACLIVLRLILNKRICYSIDNSTINEHHYFVPGLNRQQKTINYPAADKC